MFRSNEAFKKSVDKGPVELNNTISNIHTFLTAVPQAREMFFLLGVWKLSDVGLEMFFSF